jgi:hypothetical protein
MAFSLEQIRNSILTSIYGRRAGLTGADFFAGPRALQHVIEDLTTASTGASNSGHSRVIATGSSQGPVQYTLAAPVPGVYKTLSIDTTSTGSYQFLSTANGASIMAGSDGTTKSLINLVGQGGSVMLVGVTTAIWRVIAQASTGGLSYTTST